MAIARISTGDVLGAIEDINAAVAPTEVGRFDLSDELARGVAALPMPLTQEGADFILERFDSTLDARMRAEGFTYRRVGCLVPPRGKESMMGFSLKPGPEGERPADEMKAGQTPHRTHVNECHFVLSGAIMKGLQLDDGRQAVVYVTAGEWMRLHEVTLNWVVYPAGQPVNAVSYYDREPHTEDMRYDMTAEPDHRILETMTF